jgi:hypothetical protein
MKLRLKERKVMKKMKGIMIKNHRLILMLGILIKLYLKTIQVKIKDNIAITRTKIAMLTHQISLTEMTLLIIEK